VQIFGLEAAAGSGVVKLPISCVGLSVRYGSPGIGGGGGGDGDDGGALRSHPVGYTLLILNIYSAAMCSTLGGISRLPGFSCSRIYYYY